MTSFAGVDDNVSRTRINVSQHWLLAGRTIDDAVRWVLPARKDRASRAVFEKTEVYASIEMVMPAYLPGTAPIATPNEMIFVLGEFRGDIWMMDL